MLIPYLDTLGSRRNFRVTCGRYFLDVIQTPVKIFSRKIIVPYCQKIVRVNLSCLEYYLHTHLYLIRMGVLTKSKVEDNSPIKILTLRLDLLKKEAARTASRALQKNRCEARTMKQLNLKRSCFHCSKFSFQTLVPAVQKSCFVRYSSL